MMVLAIMMYMAMTTPPYPDLIARQNGLNVPIDAPLSTERRRAVIEAMWNRERDYHIRDFAFGETNLRLPRPHQQMALFHILHGGYIRRGDFSVLHGTLLSALQPNTYRLAKEWQALMDCSIHAKKDDPECVGY
jgi:hypothetical protein